MIIPDISRSDRLQYPEAAVQEGVAATVSMPILFLQEGIDQVGKGLRYLSISERWDAGRYLNSTRISGIQDITVFNLLKSLTSGRIKLSKMRLE